MMRKFFNNNQLGFTTPLLFLGAFLVLFVTISLIKVGTLEKIDPDLSRIGINLGPQSTPSNLAQEETTTSPTQPLESIETSEVEETITASSTLDIDNDAEAEGDNPPYIE